MSALAHAELLAIIADCESNHPRSLQKEIGPSEIGDLCERKLGFKVWEVPGRSLKHSKWRSTVGTAIHSWMDTCFAADPDRWLCESRVITGTWHDGEKERVLGGKCDLFDLERGCVVDFKTTSKHKMADYARGNIPELYRIQIHCYGLGMANAGRDVQSVGLLFLPRDDDLNLASSVYWEEPFDAQVALDALARLTDIAHRSIRGDFASLQTAQSFCARCEWYSPNGNPASGTCPGEIRSYLLDDTDPFAS